VVDQVVERLTAAYMTIRIGNPLAEGTLVGPLINQRAVDGFLHAVAKAKEQGGTVVTGGQVVKVAGSEGGFYVQPTIIRAPAGNRLAIALEETFAPILYVFTYKEVDEALAMNNMVDQGLSSACFTDSMQVAEKFLSFAGSDCGIANVNAGTSGAEIGGGARAGQWAVTKVHARTNTNYGRGTLQRVNVDPILADGARSPVRARRRTRA
jgi:aldehyde dehydrogenase (NAD+)